MSVTYKIEMKFNDDMKKKSIILDFKFKKKCFLKKILWSFFEHIKYIVD